MRNEVIDISEQITSQKLLVGLLETYIDGIDEPIQAKVYEEDGAYFATYSHRNMDKLPPRYDAVSRELIEMKIIASQYLAVFINGEDIQVNEDF